jgi:hypothetical protein
MSAAPVDNNDDTMMSSAQKSLDWEGWEEGVFCIEMQQPWAELILKGRKTIETRAYPLPPALINKPVLIIESPQGEARQSSLGDQLEWTLGAEIQEGVRLVGWCRFGSVTEYRSLNDFGKDVRAHLVEGDSPFGWKEDTEKIYGWKVTEVGRNVRQALSGINIDPVKQNRLTAIRRMRSLFQLNIARLRMSPTPPNA